MLRRILSSRAPSTPASPSAGSAPGASATDQRIAALEARLTDLETQLAQLQSVLVREDHVVPPPPKHMQVRVVGGYVPAFIESGYSIAAELQMYAEVAGTTLADCHRILDFGCGSGRNTRALRTLYPQAELHGTDIDPEAIAWLRAHAGRVADFRVAPHRPPTSYENDYFDYIFGISVFTHLPEDMQFLWLEELRRIAKPGAVVLLTTSGENNYRKLPVDLRRQLEAKGIHFLDGGYGQSISLPEFYQNTFHTLGYIAREWAKYFDILEMRPVGMQQSQDAIVLRKRG